MEKESMETGNYIETICPCASKTYEYDKGELYLIVDLVGLKTGVPSQNSYYKGRNLDDWSLHKIKHGHLKKLKNRKEMIPALKLTLKRLDELKESVKYQIEFHTNYKDEEDFLAHKIIEMMENENDVRAIRELLKKKPTKFL